VRQAIYYALDRQEILNVANSGFGTPLNAGYLPPDRFGAISENNIYGKADIEKAKQLLSEAGFANGFEAKLMVIATSAFQVRSAEVEQQQLAKIGIKVTIESVESTIADTKTKAADFDMYQSGFGLTYDPDERFSASFLKGGGLNYGQWTDPEYEALIVQARSELDKTKRADLYKKAEKILAERGPVAMTFLNADFDVVQKNVMGYKGDPTPTYRFYRNLWLDK
jgi:peptide/nickel transport system substrate-binding protein